MDRERRRLFKVVLIKLKGGCEFFKGGSFGICEIREKSVVLRKR